MQNHAYQVKAVWDDEASVWVATSDDALGLVTEASTTEVLIEKLKILIPELLDANGLFPPTQEVHFEILSE